MRRLLLLGLCCGIIFGQNVRTLSDIGLPATFYVGTQDITAYTPVLFQLATPNVMPAGAPLSGAIGIALMDGKASSTTPIAVAQSGVVPCIFDNTPVPGDVAMVGVNGCRDMPAGNSRSVNFKRGYLGRILCTTAAANCPIPVGITGSVALINYLGADHWGGQLNASDITNDLGWGPQNSRNIVSVSADYSTASTDYAVVVTQSATITLGTPAAGQIVIVKNLSSGNITVTAGTGLIDTMSTFTLHAGDSLTVQNIKNTPNWIVE